MVFPQALDFRRCHSAFYWQDGSLVFRLFFFCFFFGEMHHFEICLRLHLQTNDRSLSTFPGNVVFENYAKWNVLHQTITVSNRFHNNHRIEIDNIRKLNGIAWEIFMYEKRAQSHYIINAILFDVKCISLYWLTIIHSDDFRIFFISWLFRCCESKQSKMLYTSKCYEQTVSNFNAIVGV